MGYYKGLQFVYPKWDDFSVEAFNPHTQTISCDCANQPAPTANDKTRKALKEIAHAQNKAALLLQAADSIRGLRYDDVSAGQSMNGNATAGFAFKKIDVEADKKSNVEDQHTHAQMNMLREQLANDIATIMHNAARTMLVLCSQASAKVVAPELREIQARMNAQKEAEAKKNVNEAPKQDNEPVKNAGRVKEEAEASKKE